MNVRTKIIHSSFIALIIEVDKYITEFQSLKIYHLESK